MINTDFKKSTVRTVLPLSWGLKRIGVKVIPIIIHDVRTVLPLSWGLKPSRTSDILEQNVPFERYYPFLGDWNRSFIHYSKSPLHPVRTVLPLSWGLKRTNIFPTTSFVYRSNGITPFLGIETEPFLINLENIKISSNGITPFLGIET